MKAKWLYRGIATLSALEMVAIQLEWPRWVIITIPALIAVIAAWGMSEYALYAATLDAHGEGAVLLEDRAQRLWRTQDFSPETLSDLAVALDQVKIRFYANRVPLSQRIHKQAEAATREFYEAFP